jgi:hypothetical protein
MAYADEATILGLSFSLKEIANLRDGFFPADRPSGHPSFKRVGGSLQFRRQLSLIHSQAHPNLLNPPHQRSKPPSLFIPATRFPPKIRVPLRH